MVEFSGDLDAIRSLCKNYKISPAYERILELQQKASERGVSVDSAISVIMRENVYAFKYVFFRQVSSTSGSDFTEIKATLEHINGLLVNDGDINAMLEQIEACEKGTVSVTDLKRYAYNASEAAGAKVGRSASS